MAAPVYAASLSRTASTVQSLVPPGWHIEQQHRADFDRDGRADVLLLLKHTIATAGTPRRMILVALASARPNGFKVVVENASLIPEDSGGGMEDPMANGDIEVRRGWFQLTLGMTPALGSYDNATLRFAFSYTSGCFRLVRYERLETHRATLDTHDLRVDYLTGKVVQSTGNDQSSEKRIERGRLKRNPRRCLDDLGSAWTFDPLN